MKKLLFGLAFCGGFALSLVAARQMVPTELVRAELATSLAKMIGGPVEILGTPDVSVIPTLKVRFEAPRVMLAGRAEPIAEMKTLVVRLDILPLLAGRISIAEIGLRAPVLRLERSLSGEALVPNRAALAALEPGRVTIDDGQVQVTDPATGRSETFDGLSAAFVWPRLRGGASVEANFRWRGEAVALVLQGQGPRALAEGESGQMAGSLSSRALRVAFDGKGLIADTLQLDGVLEVAAADLGRAAAWLGGSIASGPLLRDFALSGRLRSLGYAATVADARLKLDGNAADGVVSVRLDAPRPQVRATLAWDQLDLGRYRAALADGHWRQTGIDAAALGRADLDLRLSASQLRLGTTGGLDKVAATLLVKDGRLDAEIADAAAFGGSLRAVLRGEPRGDGYRATGRFAGSGLAAAGVARTLGLNGIQDGDLAVSFEGEANGRTLGGLLAGLEGRIGAEARNLVVAAVDAVASGARFLPIAFSNPVAARAPTFTRVVLEAGLTGHALRIGRLDADGPLLSARVTGEASLASGLLSLRGRMTMPDRAGEPRTAEARKLEIPIRIGGTFADPIAAVVTAETPFGSFEAR